MRCFAPTDRGYCSHWLKEKLIDVGANWGDNVPPVWNGTRIGDYNSSMEAASSEPPGF